MKSVLFQIITPNLPQQKVPSTQFAPCPFFCEYLENYLFFTGKVYCIKKVPVSVRFFISNIKAAAIRFKIRIKLSFFGFFEKKKISNRVFWSDTLSKIYLCIYQQKVEIKIFQTRLHSSLTATYSPSCDFFKENDPNFPVAQITPLYPICMYVYIIRKQRSISLRQDYIHH